MSMDMIYRFRDDGTYIIQKMFNDGAIGTGGPYTYQKLSDNELIFLMSPVHHFLCHILLLVVY